MIPSINSSLLINVLLFGLIAMNTSINGKTHIDIPYVIST